MTYESIQGLLSPAAIAAAIAGIFGMVGLLINLVVNGRVQRVDAQLKYHTAQINEINAQISKRMAELRESELRSASVYRVAEMMWKRYERLFNDVSELNSLLTRHSSSPGPFPSELTDRAVSLCSSISYVASPRGAFNEEFNTQLGHIREFFFNGGDYLKKRTGLTTAFNLNCWILLDSEFEQITKTVLSGGIQEKPDLRPYKWPQIV